MAKPPNHPLSFRFVSQSGRLVDAQTKRAVRSHAMREVRSRQKKKHQNTVNSLCQCSTPIPASPTVKSGWRIDENENTNLPLVVSKRCVCGGMSFVECLPPEVVGMVVTGAGLAIFGVGTGLELELPVRLVRRFGGEIEGIKAHALAFCAPGPVKTNIIPEALRTPALLTSILYMAYANLCSVRGYSNKELALGLKTAAIGHVNRQMGDARTATATNVIASVGYLSAGTWVLGNARQETAVHMKGIELMVRERKEGLGMLEFGQTVQKTLLILHLTISALTSQPANPIFNLPYPTTPPTTGHARHASPLDSLSGLSRARNCSPETLAVLFETKHLIDVLLSPLQHHNPLPSICHRLRQHPPSASNWIYESCRLTALVLLDAVERRRAKTDALHAALKKSNLGDGWGDMLGCLVFVSLVGVGGRLLPVVVELGFEGEEGLGVVVRGVRRFGSLMGVLRWRGKEGE